MFEEAFRDTVPRLSQYAAHIRHSFGQRGLPDVALPGDF